MTAAPEPPAGGHLTVVAGPSGAGKGTVIAEVLRRHPEVWLSVSATTRKPRPGEVDGASYHFVDDDAFAAAVARGEYLEHATYAGHSYGTPAQPVRERLAAGVPCLLEIDLQGARQVRATLGSLARLVFLAPPSAEELERRLTARGTEDPAALARRLARAREEMKAEGEFDAVVVNGDVGEAATRLAAQLLDSAGRP